MRRRAVTALIAAPLAGPALGGCFPAVLHGPAVRPGLNGVVLISRAEGPTYVEGDEGGIRLRNPPVGVGLGYGWRAASPARPSVYVGAFGPLPALDLYVQAPSRWTGATAGGLGANFQIGTTTPYVQWGRVSAGGSGFSTIQGLSIRDRFSAHSRSLAWIPGLIAHAGEGNATLHVFAMGAIGREPGDCLGGYPGSPRPRACERGRASRVLLLGGAIEFHRRTPLR